MVLREKQTVYPLIITLLLIFLLLPPATQEAGVYGGALDRIVVVVEQGEISIALVEGNHTVSGGGNYTENTTVTVDDVSFKITNLWEWRWGINSTLALNASEHWFSIIYQLPEGVGIKLEGENTLIVEGEPEYLYGWLNLTYQNFTVCFSLSVEPRDRELSVGAVSFRAGVEEEKSVPLPLYEGEKIGFMGLEGNITVGNHTFEPTAYILDNNLVLRVFSSVAGSGELSLWGEHIHISGSVSFGVLPADYVVSITPYTITVVSPTNITANYTLMSGEGEKWFGSFSKLLNLTYPVVRPDKQYVLEVRCSVVEEYTATLKTPKANGSAEVEIKPLEDPQPYLFRPTTLKIDVFGSLGEPVERTKIFVLAGGFRAIVGSSGEFLVALQTGEIRVFSSGDSAYIINQTVAFNLTAPEHTFRVIRAGGKLQVVVHTVEGKPLINYPLLAVYRRRKTVVYTDWSGVAVISEVGLIMVVSLYNNITVYSALQLPDEVISIGVIVLLVASLYVATRTAGSAIKRRYLEAVGRSLSL